jgi:hypothetical protein
MTPLRVLYPFAMVKGILAEVEGPWAIVWRELALLVFLSCVQTHLREPVSAQSELNWVRLFLEWF